MAVRPVDRLLGWLGADRLLLDDVSRFGLRRRVLARKGEWIDIVTHIHQSVQAAKGAEVFYWMFERDEYFYLWIVWKETK
jgi:hypothetical protein